MHQFNKRLKDLRKRYNISQNALAKQMKLTRATINAWEMGISYPNAQSLVMLSDYFNVSADYLLGINNSDMINISMLNEREKSIICEMVTYFTDIKNS